MITKLIKLEIDQDDVSYLKFSNNKIVETREVEIGDIAGIILMDLDKDNKIVGIEFVFHSEIISENKI